MDQLLSREPLHARRGKQVCFSICVLKTCDLITLLQLTGALVNLSAYYMIGPRRCFSLILSPDVSSLKVFQ